LIGARYYPFLVCIRRLRTMDAKIKAGIKRKSIN